MTPANLKQFSSRSNEKKKICEAGLNFTRYLSPNKKQQRRLPATFPDKVRKSVTLELITPEVANLSADKAQTQTCAGLITKTCPIISTPGLTATDTLRPLPITAGVQSIGVHDWGVNVSVQGRNKDFRQLADWDTGSASVSDTIRQNVRVGATVNILHTHGFETKKPLIMRYKYLPLPNWKLDYVLAS